MNKNGGFVEAGLLVTAGIISLGTLSFLLQTSASLSYTAAVKRETQKRESAESVLADIGAAMNLLTSDEADSPFGETLTAIEKRFGAYNCAITDVSSGINTYLWPEKLLEKPPIKELTLRGNPEYTVSYGWISALTVSGKTLEKLKKSFDVSNGKTLFPLVNTYALVNIHFLHPDILNALLEAFSLPRAPEKAAALCALAERQTLDEKTIAAVLEISPAHELSGILGVKTAFWQVQFTAAGYEVSAVFAAIPNKIGNPRMPRSYELLERRLIRVGE